MKKTGYYYGIAVLLTAMFLTNMSAVLAQGETYVYPSVETVANGSYPIARDLYLYTDGEPTGLAKNLIDYVHSPMGQAAVAEESFVAKNSIGLRPGDDTTYTLTIEGSTTVAPIATIAKEIFEDLYPGTSITLTGSGSGDGIAALIDGTTDIAMASRGMKDSEKTDLPDWQEFTVAKDGIAVITHPDNPVTELTLEELAQIYDGNITNWQDVGGNDATIQYCNRDASSGTRGVFHELVLEPYNTDYYTTGAGYQELASNGAMQSYVQVTPDAIAYVGLGFVSGVNVLEIEGVAASADTVVDGSYAIARDLYLYTDGVPTGVAKHFIDFMLSPIGQMAAEEESFVPIDDTMPFPDYGTYTSTLNGSLVIEGSTTVSPIMTIVKEDFESLYPLVSITLSGTGSGDGISALIDGTVDIAMASRAMKDSEKADLPDWNEEAIAADGIAVIVNPDNTLTQLTLGEVKAIYRGNITNWQDVGGPDLEIVVINRDASSGTRGFFHEFVLDEEDFVSTAIEKASNGAVHDEVAQTPGAIGYVGLGFIDEEIVALEINSDTTIPDTVTEDDDDDKTTIPGYGLEIFAVISVVAIVGLIFTKNRK